MKGPLLAVALLAAFAAVHADAAPPVWTRVGPEGGSITAFVSVPGHSATAYAGFLDGGIYRSDDRGATWRFAGAGSGKLRIAGLAVDASNPQTLYAASGSLGIAKTVDGGVSWRPSAAGIPLGQQLPVVAVATDATRAGQAYAAARTAAIYKTTDGGATWKSLPAGGPRDVIALVADPRISNRL